MERLRQAVRLNRAAGDPTGGSAAVTLGELLRLGGYAKESGELLAPFRNSSEGLEPVVHARALLGLSLNLMFEGRSDEAGSVIEESLAHLEDAMEWAGLADGLIARGVFLVQNRRPAAGMSALFFSTIAAARGDSALLDRCAQSARRCIESPNVDVRASATVSLANLALIEGDAAEAERLARKGFDAALSGELWAEAFRVGVEATLVMGNEAAMDELATWVDQLPPARKLPLFRAGAARLGADLAHLSGSGQVARGHEREAGDMLRELEARPLLAAALLDRVRRRGDELALAEARQILEDLGATRWLEHLASDARRLVG